MYLCFLFISPPVHLSLPQSLCSILLFIHYCDAFYLFFNLSFCSSPSTSVHSSISPFPLFLLPSVSLSLYSILSFGLSLHSFIHLLLRFIHPPLLLFILMYLFPFYFSTCTCVPSFYSSLSPSLCFSFTLPISSPSICSYFCPSTPPIYSSDLLSSILPFIPLSLCIYSSSVLSSLSPFLLQV